MGIHTALTTARLVIEPLAADDYKFIYQLVNTPGWIRFIGDKKIYSHDDATAYIRKLTGNPNTVYWTVKLKDGTSIGLVTFIKRDFLEHHDIGFALLPEFSQNGYAFEAVYAVLTHLLDKQVFTHILAITLPNNIRSISLLRRLGLNFEEEIQIEKEVLHRYGASVSALRLHLMEKKSFESD